MSNDEKPTFKITGPGELKNEPIGQDNNPLEVAKKRSNLECIQVLYTTSLVTWIICLNPHGIQGRFDIQSSKCIYFNYHQK